MGLCPRFLWHLPGNAGNIHDCLGIFHAKSKIQTAKLEFNREITKPGISGPKAGNRPFSRDFSGERFHRTICRVFFVGNAGSTLALDGPLDGPYSVVTL
jgi:hypothetical protein